MIGEQKLLSGSEKKRRYGQRGKELRTKIPILS